MLRYGLTREQLSSIAITQRAHAALNPSAIYTEPLDVTRYLDARMVSEPLCVYDCDIACDGATAFVVSCADHTSGLDHPAVTVEALDCADHDRFLWEAGEDITRISSRWSTIWDPPTSPSPTSTTPRYMTDSVCSCCAGWEDFGFCKEVGESGEFVTDLTRIYFGGELPINTRRRSIVRRPPARTCRFHEACPFRSVAKRVPRQVDGASLAAVGVGAANSGTTAMLVASALRVDGSNQRSRNERRVKLGFVGLGQMGARIAKRMVAWPGGVSVFDVSSDAMKRLADTGASLADSVAEVASADIIGIAVLDDAQVREVITGKNGSRQMQGPAQ